MKTEKIVLLESVNITNHMCLQKVVLLDDGVDLDRVCSEETWT